MSPVRRGVKILGTEVPRSRYVPLSTLRRFDDREVTLARDSLSGHEVVLKTSRPAAALHEARCLLALPEGIAPRLRSIVPLDRARVTLVLESIAPESLADLARRVPVSQVPGLVRTLTQVLADLHRTGWVHADLKPDNVLARRTHRGFEIRLIDFDFAIDQYSAASRQVRGGRPGFIAPEVAQGWLVDGRADLFSLGAVIQCLWPAVRRDPRWKPILSGLLEVYPADRPRDAAEVEAEVTSAFALKPTPRRWPTFPAGPLQGRADEIEEALRLLRGSKRPRVLVQARPGTGLSRFLLEAALAHAGARRTRLRVVDLGDCRERPEPALEILKASVASNDAVLCGIPDPSPDLRWLDDEAGDQLRTVLGEQRWTRLSLSAPDETTIEEMIHATLGERTAAGTDLANVIHRSGEGDLRIAREGFGAAIESCGEVDDNVLQLDPRQVSKWSRTWSPACPVEPTLESVPKRLRPGLQLCASLGRSFRREVAADLHGKFAPAGQVDDLIAHGYLTASGDRLEFVTQQLWRDAAARGLTSGAEVDAWLVANYRPDLSHVEAVLAVCRAARRLDRAETERSVLGSALEDASRHRRWDDVLRLVAYPSTPPSAWTERNASLVATRSSRLLGPTCSVDYLRSLLGVALLPAMPSIGVKLLERSAYCADPRAAASALLVLADRYCDGTDGAAFTRYEAALRSLLEHESRLVPRGVMDHLAGRRAYADRKLGEAQIAAEEAQMVLAVGLVFYALNLQLSAVLQFTSTPSRAIKLMERAANGARDAETRAQVRYNLSLAHSRMGELQEAAACSDRALREAQGRVTPAREMALRIRRAWDWAAADRVEPALQEALSLLGRASVRTVPRHLVPVRLLLGYCLLHQGQTREALRVILRAWSDSAAAPELLRMQSLRFVIDTVIDTNSIRVVRARTRDFARLHDASVDAPPALRARVQALVAQALLQVREATAILEAGLPDARRLPDVLDRARYLHHLAILIGAGAESTASASRGREAIALLDEELELLPTSGRSYYRAIALLCRAVTEWSVGQPDQSRGTLGAAIELARDTGSRGVLHRALAVQRAWGPPTR